MMYPKQEVRTWHLPRRLGVYTCPMCIVYVLQRMIDLLVGGVFSNVVDLPDAWIAGSWI